MLVRSQSVVLIVLLLAHSLLAQTSAHPTDPAEPTEPTSKSVAEMAQESKTKKAKAKTIITDDDLDQFRGPIPALAMEGLDNANEIVSAIKNFSRQHKPQETEQVIHEWYDNYDAMLATAIKENIELKDLGDENRFNGLTLCEEPGNRDYRACVNRQQLETRSARHDSFKMRDNNLLAGRIQQAFMRIRASLVGSGLRYDWFKIRTTNNNGYY
jgi:hypothetical protein